jgi:DNA-binding winged helix-turn-helix (wHTH) protein
LRGDDRPGARYDFGPFRLDAADGVLLRDGEPVVLTPKVFATLLALVRRQGRVVSRDVLVSEIWPDTFVEEGNLTQNISTLRKVLGEDASGRSYIDTVPKRGYRFTAAVVALPPAPVPAPVATTLTAGHAIAFPEAINSLTSADMIPIEPEVATANQPIRPPEATRFSARTAFALAVGVIAAAIGVMGMVRWLERGSVDAHASNPGPMHSLAVLPFKTLPPNGRQGFSPERLVKATRLAVIDVNHSRSCAGHAGVRPRYKSPAIVEAKRRRSATSPCMTSYTRPQSIFQYMWIRRLRKRAIS